MAGAVAGAAGVTGALAVDGALSWVPLVAITLNVYCVPLVSPVTFAVVTLPTTRSSPTWVAPATVCSEPMTSEIELRALVAIRA